MKQFQKATFAAGCFWGVEETFRVLNGVKDTRVGYTGGHIEDPTYREVCSGQTGHAEALEIEFDPKVISYDQLLNIFWQCHNPMTLNRQGPDIGSQYRSAIFFHDQEQKVVATQSLQALEESGKYPLAIVTEITAASTFYPAEEYHQKYVLKNGGSSCHL